jgi:hypothetical protein
VVLAVALGAGIGWRQWRPRPEVNPGLRAQLAARVTSFLELDPRWRTRATYEPGPRPVCESYVFGADPVDVSDVAQVRTVYAWVDCRWLPPVDQRAGVGLPDLPAEVTPIAVNLGPPVTFRVADDGRERHARSFEQIFPPELRDTARRQPSGFATTAARLDRRVGVLLGEGPPSATAVPPSRPTR